jgi:hypothetical protein
MQEREDFWRSKGRDSAPKPDEARRDLQHEEYYGKGKQ